MFALVYGKHREAWLAVLESAEELILTLDYANTIISMCGIRTEVPVSDRRPSQLDY